MATWIPMFALPNIDVEESIERPGIAIVSLRDKRLKALVKNHPRFAVYLRFETEFGLKVWPSILLRESASPERYRTAEALAGFRDAVAISVIPHSWAHTLRFETRAGIRYANWFSFYPWMTDAKYEGIIMQSMARLGYDDRIEALRAQTTAGFSYDQLAPRLVDRPLLEAVLDRWVARFATDTPTLGNVALFRSLNMALSASMLPGNVEATIYDIGRSIALWVSAFEILAHSGSSQVGFRQVYQLLERANWNLSECRDPIYEPYGYKEGQRKRILPVWLYGELNRARNDFLHGNKITDDRLIVAPGKRALNLYTAPLFRMALTSHLDLRMDRPPALDGKTDYEAFLAYQHEFGGYQRDLEAAIATILFTQKEYRDFRTGRSSRVGIGAKNSKSAHRSPARDSET
jgi:hypothetical protein